MHEGRGLHRLTGGLAGHSLCGQPAQLVVDQRQQVARRPAFATSDRLEDLCDLAFAAFDATHLRIPP